jgi:hypothetical protein
MSDVEMLTVQIASLKSEAQKVRAEKEEVKQSAGITMPDRVKKVVEEEKKGEKLPEAT